MNVFRSILPYLALLGGVSLGASSGLYIKSVHISSLALTAFRMGVPILVLLPGLIKGRRLAGPPGMRKLLWTTSGVNAVRMFFFVLGYRLTSVGSAVVLLYLWPVFAMIIESIQAKKRPDTTRIAIIALCFTGVVVMNLHRRFSLGSTDLLGSLSMTLAAALFAFTAINFKKALANCHETDALYFQNIVGTVLFTPFLLMELGKASLADIGIGSLYGFSVGLVASACFSWP
jgi:drug/metabolite transporter (DMT)-like permease